MSKRFSTRVLQVIHETIIELADDLAADAEAVLFVIDFRYPELQKRYGRQGIMEIADLVLKSEMRPESKQFTTVYQQFNESYFNSSLPQYKR